MGEFLLLLVGLLWGVGVSPFLTPWNSRAALAIGTAVAVLWLVGVGPLRPKIDACVPPLLILPFACALAVVGSVAAWCVTASFFRDQRPPLTYSLRLLNDDEAAQFAAHGVGPWYRLQITNLTQIDVADLHVALNLPVYLSGTPVPVRQVRVDGLRCKASYVVTIFKPEGEPPIPKAGFTNLAVVEASRLQANGSLDVIIPCERKGGQLDEFGRYGVVAVTRRHTFLNVQVNDVEAFPLVAAAENQELLDITKNDPDMKRNTFGPPISADDMMQLGKGKRVKIMQEITIE